MKVEEPCSYKEAVLKTEWIDAMEEEFAAIRKNETWKIADLPEGHKVIDTKWVYKIKFKPDGSIERLKARLAVRGDKQILDKDYKSTFSPAAKFASVKILIALATERNWNLHQVDINNAFMHGTLEEDVYIKVPEGFKGVPAGKVLKLKKGLYGLRQSSRLWNVELKGLLLEHNFRLC